MPFPDIYILELYREFIVTYSLSIYCVPVLFLMVIV